MDMSSTGGVPGERSAEPDLAVSEQELGAIRDDAQRLTRITDQGPQAAAATAGAVADLCAAGLTSGNALDYAMRSFTHQSLNLSRRCHHIVDHLRSTTTSHAALEYDIAARLGADRAYLTAWDHLTTLGDPDAPARDA
jgi:hypothetical protein